MKRRKAKVEENRIGNFLREARIKAGVSQIEIARKLGYSTSQFISNWERGLAKPPLKVLKKVAVILDVSQEQLFQMLLDHTVEKLTQDLKKEFYGR